MGFDNECIVNIHSLAGEYFCPVCRTLVYPNEALQSQCTHLYCKPCLTYVVGTTKACPYDGYLVTEEHSKPLVESDKALAEKIDKTLVHCLFHRSGCSWQGPLSQCTSHCSGCSFGNSPVVCNRCGIQIVHRQVQEHAQNCAGANPQAQQTTETSKDPATSVAATTASSSQTSSQVVGQASQAPVSQIATAPPSAHNANPLVQANTSAAGATAEQWYPQQFQQYYQQYPAYDPYQQSYQQYYPYQQQTAQQLPQHAPHVGQPQVYAQHQTAIQSHHQPLQQVQGQSQAHIQPQLLAQQQPPSQHQLQIPPQGQPQGPYVQNQVNPQQSHLVTQPQPQIQPHTQPTAQGQIPSQQPYPQVQPHQLNHSMQPHAQQNFQAPQNQQAQSQGHQGQLQVQPHSQPQNHPHLPPLQPNNLQSQQPAPHVVPAYQSHPPVQPHQQLMQAPPQYPMHMHPSSGSFPLAAQFPSPQMPPQQANVSVTNQQQPNLMPSQSQMRGVPPAQLQQIRPQAPQQGHTGHQRPAVQPMQQPLQQYGQQAFPLQASGSVRGPVHQLPFAHQPMSVQSRPQGPNQFLQQSGIALPAPPPHNSVQAHGMPTHQPQTHAGRPVAPNQSTASQPFPQSGGTFGVNAQPRPIPSSSVQPSEQVPLGQQFSRSGLGEENAVGQEVGSALKNTAGKDVSSAGVDSVGVKVLASDTGEKSGDEEHRITSEGGNNGTHKGIMGKVEGAEMDALKLGFSEHSMKKDVKEEDANGNLDPLSGGNKIETAALGERDGNVVPPMQAEYSSGKDSNLLQKEAYMGHGKDDTSLRTQENKLSHEQVTPQGPAFDEYGRFQDKGLMNSSSSVPFIDQGRHQLPPGSYGPSYHQQRPAMPSDLQSGVHPYESFEGVQRRQHYQNNSTHSQPMFSRTLKAEHTEGSLHGPDGAPMQHNQRPHHFEGRYPDPHVPGPFDRGQYGQQPLANESRVPGFDAASGLRVKSTDGNPFLSGPPGRIGQREYEDAPKQFPKPSVMGVEPSSNFGNGFSSRAGDYPPHEFNYDTPSRFLPPYHPSGAFHPNDIRERPTGFNEDHRARGFAARTQPDFHGSGPGFGVDHRPPRSPGREYHSVPARGFGGISGAPPSQSGLLDGAHGRDTRAVHEGSRSSDISSDPAGKPFPEHFRNGNMVGQDFIPNHLHRGELFGPKNGQSHLRVGDGFGTSSDPGLNYPRLGEPGYRSSYTLHGFPSDGGFFAGNNNSFDRFRKRMPTSMGWCRICRVDCETVDGLDLHSQTTEHQQRTMDMVISIKQQNAKRQKNSKDHSSAEEGSRSRNASNRGRGKKA